MGNDLKQQWDSVNRVDPRQRIENLRRILDYRDIWPKLMNDLSMACMAFEPQKELLTTEYDKIAAIPRERRQQVVIESITAHYRLRTDANAKLDTSGKVTSRQSQEYVDIWGELEGAEEEGPPPDSGKVDDDPFGLSGPRKVTAVKAQKGPEFIITMTGHTPHADGPQQLEEKLIGWLNEHYIQENRPFRIVATREALTSVGRRVAAGEKKDRSSGNTGGDLTFSGGPQEEKKPGTLPLIAPPVGKKLVEDEDVEEGEDGGEFTEDVKLDALLPSRPLLEENVENDWQFTIQFAVQVLRPEEARQIQAERMRKEEEKKKGKLPPAPAPEPEKTGAIDGNKNSASS
jgi:hypothetical protein